MVSRRVQEAADEGDLTVRVYPYRPWTTAASYHAHEGVVPMALQALMGWSDLATVRKYIRISGAGDAKPSFGSTSSGTSIFPADHRTLHREGTPVGLV